MIMNMYINQFCLPGFVDDLYIYRFKSIGTIEWLNIAQVHRCIAIYIIYTVYIYTIYIYICISIYLSIYLNIRCAFKLQGVFSNSDGMVISHSVFFP